MAMITGYGDITLSIDARQLIFTVHASLFTRQMRRSGAR